MCDSGHQRGVRISAKRKKPFFRGCGNTTTFSLGIFEEIKRNMYSAPSKRRRKMSKKKLFSRRQGNCVLGASEEINQNASFTLPATWAVPQIFFPGQYRHQQRRGREGGCRQNKNIRRAKTKIFGKLSLPHSLKYFRVARIPHPTNHGRLKLSKSIRISIPFLFTLKLFSRKS